MALANITNNILTDSGILVTNLTPTTRTLTINGTTYDLSADRSWSIATHDAVTIGTANGLSLSGQVLSLGLASGSANGALSSTDWTTFNNKQSALTNPVTGTGTTNYLPKFTGASTIGNSQIFDNGTNVGIGTATPETNLQIVGSTFSIIRVTSTGSNVAGIDFGNTSNSDDGRIRFTPGGSMEFFTNDQTRLNLNNSGNLGLGVTPSAWGSSWKALELSNGVYLTALSSSTVPIMILGANAYFDNTNFIYKTTAAATRYQQDSGVHYWYNAPSGTAGNAISFTQAMTLDASGRLMIGTTTAEGKLTINNSSFPAIKVNQTASGHAAAWLDTNEYGLAITSASTSTAHYLTNMSSGGASRFYVRTDGNVGIGTTSPLGKLHSLSTTSDYAIVADNTLSGTQNFILFRAGANIGDIIRPSGTNDVRLNSNFGSIVFGTDGSGTAAERMRINNNGNVGIGTTSPSTILHLNSTTTQLTLQNTNGGTNAERIGMFMTGGDTFKLISLNDNNTTRVDNIIVANVLSGNVGIGTTSPQGNLEVVGLSYFTRSGQTLLVNPNYGGAGTHTQLQVVGNMALAFATNGDNERMRITSGGDVGIGTTSPSSPLSFGKSVYGAPSSEDFFRIKFEDFGGTNNDVGIGQPATSCLGFNSAAAGYTSFNEGTNGERMRIAAGGNVGIGTTAPNSLLEVNKTITFSSIDTYAQLVVKTTSGANGKLLNIGVDETNSVSFIQSLNRGTDAMPLSLQRYGGAVLIGTTTEGFLGKLQVAGSVAITGQYNTVLPSSSFSYFDGSGQVVSSSSNASALYLDTTWNTTGNPDGIYLNVTNTASGSSSKLLNLKVGSVSQFSVSKGGAIQTSDPTNGTARPWKLGDARSGGISTDSYIIVEVNGVTYSIPALNGLP